MKHPWDPWKKCGSKPKELLRNLAQNFFPPSLLLVDRSTYYGPVSERPQELWVRRSSNRRQRWDQPRSTTNLTLHPIEMTIWCCFCLTLWPCASKGAWQYQPQFLSRICLDNQGTPRKAWKHWGCSFELKNPCHACAVYHLVAPVGRSLRLSVVRLSQTSHSLMQISAPYVPSKLSQSSHHNSWCKLPTWCPPLS